MSQKPLTHDGDALAETTHVLLIDGVYAVRLLQRFGPGPRTMAKWLQDKADTRVNFIALMEPERVKKLQEREIDWVEFALTSSQADLLRTEAGASAEATAAEILDGSPFPSVKIVLDGGDTASERSHTGGVLRDAYLRLSERFHAKQIEKVRARVRSDESEAWDIIDPLHDQLVFTVEVETGDGSAESIRRALVSAYELRRPILEQSLHQHLLRRAEEEQTRAEKKKQANEAKRKQRADARAAKDADPASEADDAAE